MAKEIKFRIRLSVDGKEQLVTASTNIRDFKKGMDAAKSSATKFRDAVLTFNQLGQAFQGVMTGLSAVNSAMTSYTQAFSVQEQNEKRLETVMRQRMSATAEDVAQMKQLAAAQQQLGIIGDEVQLAGMQQVATFLTQKDTLAMLVPAMNNLIAQQKGYNATAADAQAVGNLMGKAMQGQATALRRVGISFNAAQEQVLKFGTESEKAAMLAEIITQNVGNMNVQLRDTQAGQMKALSNTMGDLSEKIGAVMLPFQGIMQQVTQLGFLFMGLGGIVSAGRAIFVAFGAAIKATGVASIFFSKQALITQAAIYALNGASAKAALSMAALKLALRGVLIASGIGVALWAITAAIEAISGASDKAADNVKDLSKSGKEISEAYGQAKAQLEGNVSKLKELIEQKRQGKDVTKQEKEVLANLNATYGETMGYFSSVEAWYKALIANSEAYCDQMVIEAQMRRLANQIAEKEEQKHSILYNSDGTRRKYSTEKEKGLKASGNAQAPLTYGVTGPSELDKAQDKLNGVNGELYNLNKQLEGLINKRSKIRYSVTGATAPTGATTTGHTGSTTGRGGSAKTGPDYQAGSLADLNAQLSAQQKLLETENLTLEQQIAIYTRIADIQEKINTLKSQQAEAQWSVNKDKMHESLLPTAGAADALSVGVKLVPTIDMAALKDAANNLVKGIKSNVESIPTIMGLTAEKFNAATGALDNFGGAMQQMGKLAKDEGLEVAGIVAQAIANIALGYAQATAQAGKLGPWGWAAFAAAGLGQMIGMIAAIHSATGYATGGIVGGNSYNGDHLIARLNSGEMILNKTQQSKLWALVNGRTALEVRPAMNMAGVAGAAGGNVSFRIEGRQLVGVMANETRVSSRSGRRTNIKV